MSGYPFEFTGRVAKHDYGPFSYTVVYLPVEMEGDLPFGETARVRVRGEIEEVPFAGAWQPGQGRKYLILSRSLLKKRELSVGDWVSVRFRLDDPEAVDVPEDLAEALRKHRKVKKLWDALSAGKQRGLAHFVNGVKSEEARQKRIEKALGLLEQGEVLGPRKRS